MSRGSLDKVPVVSSEGFDGVLRGGKRHRAPWALEDVRQASSLGDKVGNAGCE